MGKLKVVSAKSSVASTAIRIEGGAGPGVQSIGLVTIHDSIIKGTPGIQIERGDMTLENTKVEGGQTISKP